MKKTVAIIATIFSLVACTHSPSDVKVVADSPAIYPDYIGSTIPVGVAPLNFNMQTPDCEWMDVTVMNSKGEILHTNDTYAVFDIDDWHKLLKNSCGDSLMVTVRANIKGAWTEYNPFPIYVSKDELTDYGISYRRLAPTFNINSKYMGLYCRDLSNFNEHLVIDNRLNDNMCFNCHIQNQTSTQNMMVHIRGPLGGTYIRHNGEEEIVNTKLDSLLSVCVYNYWHPSGKYIAFSVNGTRQSFHVGGQKRIEVYDQGSDIVVYDVEKHQVSRQPSLMTDSLCETYPMFSPDGDWLYFCSAVRPENDICEEFKYDIRRIAFDSNKGMAYGNIETVVNASADSLNAIFPRISHDGKYMMYCLSEYGTFPIWHKESELHLLDMSTLKEYDMSKANSEDAESYHNWSANSRWYVFCSRRDDGLHTRLYIGHISDDGQCDKPFMLPQENPLIYYNELFQSYNTPDFCNEKIEISHTWLRQQLANGAKKVLLK